jgi:DNA-binding GntR family transcriptional regulator
MGRLKGNDERRSHPGSSETSRQFLERLAKVDVGNWRFPATAGDAAAELIRSAIFVGRLRSGDQVPVDDIIEVLDVSRLPVREAINTLKHEGLVRVEPYRGSFIGEFNEEIVREHWEIIGMLHGYAASKMTEIADAGAISRLGVVASEVAAATDHSEVQRKVFEFRRLVNQSGGTDLLRAIMRPMSRFVPAAIFQQLDEMREISKLGARNVHEAIAAGDSAGAFERARTWARAEGSSLIDHLWATGVFLPHEMEPASTSK